MGEKHGSFSLRKDKDREGERVGRKERKISDKYDQGTFYEKVGRFSDKLVRCELMAK